GVPRDWEVRRESRRRWQFPSRHRSSFFDHRWISFGARVLVSHALVLSGIGTPCRLCDHEECPVSDDFYRIRRLPPYVIAEVNAMRADARATGEDIIDLGMGNPDLPPPPHVIDKLCEVARKPDA